MCKLWRWASWLCILLINSMKIKHTLTEKVLKIYSACSVSVYSTFALFISKRHMCRVTQHVTMLHGIRRAQSACAKLAMLSLSAQELKIKLTWVWGSCHGRLLPCLRNGFFYGCFLQVPCSRVANAIWNTLRLANDRTLWTATGQSLANVDNRWVKMLPLSLQSVLLLCVVVCLLSYAWIQ